MLLTEYDEQAVMQAIAKEAEEKGEEKLGALLASMIQARESQDVLIRVSTDLAYRKKMYAKYEIK